MVSVTSSSSSRDLRNSSRRASRSPLDELVVESGVLLLPVEAFALKALDSAVEIGNFCARVDDDLFSLLSGLIEEVDLALVGVDLALSGDELVLELVAGDDDKLVLLAEVFKGFVLLISLELGAAEAVLEEGELASESVELGGLFEKKSLNLVVSGDGGLDLAVLNIDNVSKLITLSLNGAKSVLQLADVTLLLKTVDLMDLLILIELILSDTLGRDESLLADGIKVGLNLLESGTDLCALLSDSLEATLVSVGIFSCTITVILHGLEQSLVRLILCLETVDLGTEGSLELLLTNELVAETVDVLVTLGELVLLCSESVDSGGELDRDGANLLLVLKELTIVLVVILLSSLEFICDLLDLLTKLLTLGSKVAALSSHLRPELLQRDGFLGSIGDHLKEGKELGLSMANGLVTQRATEG
ncbi:hypothetical protein KCU90_g161, partial [Aureobasidium melanogenum]